MKFRNATNDRLTIAALYAGLSETYSKKGKRVRLWLEAEKAINVAVEDKEGKIILKDSFRRVTHARNRFDQLCAVMA